jgi:hypothetical protein
MGKAAPDHSSDRVRSDARLSRISGRPLKTETSVLSL